MQNVASPRRSLESRFSVWALVVFLIVLWVAGGASRADVLGQPVSRFFAWGTLVAAALLGPQFNWRQVKPVAIIFVLCVLLVLFQLVPLPPAYWASLPGRDFLAQAASVSGQVQPWRPLSVSPSETANALGSLVVPAAVIVLASALTRQNHWDLLAVLLLLIFAGSVIAILQFTGARFDNPFINYVSGSISGNFANRNHFALFVAMGCLFAPVWGFGRDQRSKWKSIGAVVVLPFFLLTILATGSRSGMVLGAIAIVLGSLIIRKAAVRHLKTLPRSWAVALSISMISVLVASIVLSFVLGRAVAIDRALELQSVEDLRTRAMPYVLEAVQTYFPAGSGFGTFDTVYRIVEPDSLLQSVYFNHAHNDWVEVVLDGGLPGAALLAGSVGWVIYATFRTWHVESADALLPRLGAATAFLVALASIPDYPARTPMIMAMIVIAAIWLNSVLTPFSRSRSQATGPRFTHDL